MKLWKVEVRDDGVVLYYFKGVDLPFKSNNFTGEGNRKLVHIADAIQRFNN